MLADIGADAPPEDVLAQALEANRQLARLVEELRAEKAWLREEAAHRDAELEQVKAALGVLRGWFRPVLGAVTAGDCGPGR
jgi:hypothetical protein